MSKFTPGPWEWNSDQSLWGGPRATTEILSAGDDGRSFGMHTAHLEHHYDGETEVEK